MKYVFFIDIDGVFNSVGYFSTDEKAIKYHEEAPDMAWVSDRSRYMRINLDPSSVRNLNYILDEIKGDKEIWISSSWGKSFDLAHIKSALKVRGMGDRVKLIKSVTPRKMSSMRCNEIHWALQEIRESYKKDISWVSIDDNAVFPRSHMDDWDDFKTHYDPEYRVDKNNGLTFQDARNILTLLVPGWKPSYKVIL